MTKSVLDMTGRRVYTTKGTLLGRVENVDLDFTSGKVNRVIIERTGDVDELELHHSLDGLTIPYTWVRGVSDAVVTIDFVDEVNLEYKSSKVQ